MGPPPRNAVPSQTGSEGARRAFGANPRFALVGQHRTQGSLRAAAPLRAARTLATWARKGECASDPADKLGLCQGDPAAACREGAAEKRLDLRDPPWLFCVAAARASEDAVPE